MGKRRKRAKSSGNSSTPPAPDSSQLFTLPPSIGKARAAIRTMFSLRSVSPSSSVRKAITEGDGSLTLLFLNGEYITFHGAVDVLVKNGIFDVGGHFLHADSGPMQLFSPIWTPGSLLAIKCMSTGTDPSGLAEISLRVSTSTLHIDRPPSCSTSTEQIAAGGTDSSVAGFNCDDVLETALALQGFYPVLGDSANGLSSLVVPEQWTRLIRDVLQWPLERRLVVMIVGERNVGKSTLARLLANSLLNKYESIGFLETDVGQCELTPSGLLSLTSLSRPLLGPAYSHVRTPRKSFFFGNTSPAANPELYSLCVEELVKFHSSQNKAGLQLAEPLVINTCGWTKGTGLELLYQIAKIANPDFIVDLSLAKDQLVESEKNQSSSHSSVDETSSSSTLPDIFRVLSESAGSGSSKSAPPTVRHLAAPCASTAESKPKVAAKALRVLSMAAYFGGSLDSKPPPFGTQSRVAPMESIISFQTIRRIIAAQRPYGVKWESVSVHFQDTEVCPSEYLAGLNCTVVALCSNPAVGSFEEIKGPSGLRCLIKRPSISSSCGLALPCLGLGIIRAIDPASHLFYVLTPVLPERLAAVTCIVRGALELPSVFMQAQDPRDDSTDVSAALPYVSVAGSGNFSFSKSDAAVGASFMKSRDNLQRKRYR